MAYFLFGYALAFGEGNGFCGTQYFALIGLPEDKMANCYFQYSFAATAATIVSASALERISMTAFCASTFLMAGWLHFIYFPHLKKCLSHLMNRLHLSDRDPLGVEFGWMAIAIGLSRFRRKFRCPRMWRSGRTGRCHHDRTEKWPF